MCPEQRRRLVRVVVLSYFLFGHMLPHWSHIPVSFWDQIRIRTNIKKNVKQCPSIIIRHVTICVTLLVLVFPNYLFYVSYVRLKLMSDQWIAAWKIAIWCTNFDEFTVTVPLTQTALNIFDIKCIKSTIKTVYLHVYVHFSYFLSLWCIWKMFFWKLSSHLVWFTGATLEQDVVF